MVDGGDITNLTSGLTGIASYVKEQWGNSVPINCILVTDGELDRVDHEDTNLFSKNGVQLPLGFSGSFNIMCVNHVDNPSFVKSFRKMYTTLLEKSQLEGIV